MKKKTCIVKQKTPTNNIRFLTKSKTPLTKTIHQNWKMKSSLYKPNDRNINQNRKKEFNFKLAKLAMMMYMLISKLWRTLINYYEYNFSEHFFIHHTDIWVSGLYQFHLLNVKYWRLVHNGVFWLSSLLRRNDHSFLETKIELIQNRQPYSQWPSGLVPLFCSSLWCNKLFLNISNWKLSNYIKI